MKEPQECSVLRNPVLQKVIRPLKSPAHAHRLSKNLLPYLMAVLSCISFRVLDCGGESAPSYMISYTCSIACPVPAPTCCPDSISWFLLTATTPSLGLLLSHQKVLILFVTIFGTKPRPNPEGILVFWCFVLHSSSAVGERENTGA